MRLPRPSRRVAAGVFFLLLALFFVRPGADRLRTRLSTSMSLALGRQVEISSVHLRALPQPGFQFENFVVHDDPAFSAEPVLRASEATAALRLTSLFRGRLEIARLDLTEPSLNLVRSTQGNWNLESLLERAAKTPVAPTSKARTETRSGFPYIQGDDGRINFKFGAEKKAFAFTEADFSFWQESEDSWGMRLKARPVRTDFNLSDTGIVRVNGSWRRAASVRETPIEFALQWDRGQLGQLSKLLYGNDKLWRGTASINGTLKGTPADLKIDAEASIQDFRRYDINGGDPLRLVAQCSAHYGSIDRTFSQLACRAPIGTGVLALEGSVQVTASPRAYDLALIAQNVPVQSLVDLAKHVKKNLPDDLVAHGRLDADFRFLPKTESKQNASAWKGGGELSGVAIGSGSNGTEMILGRIPFTISPREPRLSGANRGFIRSSAAKSDGPGIDIGPFNVALGRQTPAVARAWISRSGYQFGVQGDADLQRLLRTANTIGIPSLKSPAEGSARVDLRVAGTWAFNPPGVVGSVQLQSIRAEVRGLAAPLGIAAATISLRRDQVDVHNLSASLGGSAWRGSLAFPRPCALAGDCPILFDLHVDQLSTHQLAQFFDPNTAKRPWYRFLSPSQQGQSYLATLRASGKLSADKVLVHKLSANRVSATLDLDRGQLRLSDLRGEVLGGKHLGEWQANFTVNPPQYSGNGMFEGVALPHLAAAMQDNWITGIARGTYHVTASGLNVTQLASSVSGDLHVEAFDGSLPHVTLAEGGGSLHLHSFIGKFQLRDGILSIDQGKLVTAGGIYRVSGTASFSRNIDLQLLRENGRGFVVAGTLASPRVTAASETRAALKP